MHFRFLKQFIYGIGFLIFFGLFAFGVYSLWFKPVSSCFDHVQNQGEEGIDCGGPCAQACIPPDIKAISVGGIPRLFRTTPSGISIFAEIRNPNGDYAAQNFAYTFKLYDDQNNILREITGESFIYAGEIKYLAVFDLASADATHVQRVELVVESPQWVPEAVFKKPQLLVQNSQVSKQESGILVSGRLVNNDSVAIPQITIATIFYDQLGQPVGVSKNEVENVAPGQSQPFSVIHPSLPTADLSRTAIFLYGKRPAF